MKFIYEKKNTLKWLTLLILTNILTAYLIFSGFLKLPNTIVLQNSSQEFLNELGKINYLNNVINKRFVGDVDNTALGETLVDTMFNSLGDPYSEYFSGQEYAELMQSYQGSFGGIGITIDSSDPNSLLIRSVIDDSPAQKAGIQPNDILIKVNDEDIRGQDVDLVVSKTRGEIGTDVKVTVLRNGEEISFDLKRDTIDTQSVNSTVMDGIGYIYISSFALDTAQEFDKAVKSLIDQGVSGIVIDLRYNGGGIVNSAVEIADLLLDEDQVGYAVSKENGREYFTTKNGKYDIPFVILVNEYTASASELLSGALQKSGFTVIGQKTYGKGVIQGMSNLSDGSGYKLTIQEYFLKDDTAVNKTGITPNIVVENELNADQTEVVDHQLESALEYLRNK